MDEASLQPYREYHARRERDRRERREGLRLAVLELVREAIQRLAPGFPAIHAVYLFGSVLQGGRFHTGSDVDVAIDCADVESETPFRAALEEVVERNVDLRPRIGPVAQAVRDCGELCYEREISDSGA